MNSNNIDIVDHSKNINNNDNFLRVYHTNCNSITNKINELKVLISDFNPQILCITETHLNDSNFDAEVSLENYNIFRQDRAQLREGGGSIIYVHKSINACKLTNFTAPDSLAISVNILDNPFILACIYRSQSLTNEENFKIIEKLDMISQQRDNELLVMGDFNLPDACWDNGTVYCPVNTTDNIFLIQKYFMEFFVTRGFHWWLTDDSVTRRRLVDGKLQESLLDQILYTNPSIICGVDKLAPLGKSDHIGMICNMKIKNDVKYINTQKQNWGKFNIETIKHLEETENWQFTDENLCVENIYVG